MVKATTNPQPFDIQKGRMCRIKIRPHLGKPTHLRSTHYTMMCRMKSTHSTHYTMMCVSKTREAPQLGATPTFYTCTDKLRNRTPTFYTCTDNLWNERTWPPEVGRGHKFYKTEQSVYPRNMNMSLGSMTSAHSKYADPRIRREKEGKGRGGAGTGRE